MHHYITERQLLAGLLMGLLSLTALPVAHAAWQDLAALRPLAESFVRHQLQGTPGRIRVNVGQPEGRLRLSACESLDAFAPPGARYWGNATVGVRCSAPSAWTLYLPVTVSVMGQVVVSARAIRKGEALSEEAVGLQEVDLTQLPAGGAGDTGAVIGRVAKGPIAGGTVVRMDSLKAHPVVLQGQVVRVAYAGAGFEVHSAGRALTSGGIGEDVEVRAQSGRLLRGVVRAQGWVLVR